MYIPGIYNFVYTINTRVVLFGKNFDADRAAASRDKGRKQAKQANVNATTNNKQRRKAGS